MCHFCQGYVHKGTRTEKIYSKKERRQNHGGCYKTVEFTEVVHPKLSRSARILDGHLVISYDTEYDGRTYDREEKIKLNYCPICGTKLM